MSMWTNIKSTISGIWKSQEAQLHPWEQSKNSTQLAIVSTSVAAVANPLFFALAYAGGFVGSIGMDRLAERDARAETLKKYSFTVLEIVDQQLEKTAAKWLACVAVVLAAAYVPFFSLVLGGALGYYSSVPLRERTILALQGKVYKQKKLA